MSEEGLERIADATTDDAMATLRENVAGRREYGIEWRRTPNRHARLRAVLAELDRARSADFEALPIRYCREDPTGVVLVNVSRDAVRDLLNAHAANHATTTATPATAHDERTSK